MDLLESPPSAIDATGREGTQCHVTALLHGVRRDVPGALRGVPMTQQDYATALMGFGLPEGFAQVFADSDAQAGNGALADESRTLSRLIGRPTTPIADTIAAAL